MGEQRGLSWAEGYFQWRVRSQNLVAVELSCAPARQGKQLPSAGTMPGGAARLWRGSVFSPRGNRELALPAGGCRQSYSCSEAISQMICQRDKNKGLWGHPQRQPSGDIAALPSVQHSSICLLLASCSWGTEGPSSTTSPDLLTPGLYQDQTLQKGRQKFLSASAMHRVPLTESGSISVG